MSLHSDSARAPCRKDIAAVSLSSGGTIEGRVVARAPDGRVTLQTPRGCVTGRPVAPGWRGHMGGLGALLGWR